MNDFSALPQLRAVSLAGSGLRISYREAGDAGRPALLCLHGIGSNSSGYRHQLRELSKHLRVLSWDAPGYGASGGFEERNPGVSRYAEAAIALLDALGIERAHVAGSSLGALFAARMAAAWPARVRSLILSAPATGFACRAPGEGEAHARGRIADLERLGAQGLADERAALLVAPTASEEVRRAANELVASINPAGYSRAARALGAANIFEDAPRISAPTLIVVGTLDRVTPLADCAGPIHQAIAGSRLEVLDDVAHLIKLEAADRFNRLVSDFIAGQP